MKKILFFLLIALNLQAQEYSFVITPLDSTFNLDVITQVNDSRFAIERTVGLDTLGLQIRQYTSINDLYSSIAKARRQIDNYNRQISVLRQSLAAYGLEAYNAWSIARNDSLFQGTFTYRDNAGVITPLVTQNVDDTQIRLRLASDNALVATVGPFNNLYIRVTWQPGYGNGDTSTFFYSNNGRFYVGEDQTGARHTLTYRPE